jgi:hypothetical protein
MRAIKSPIPAGIVRVNMLINFINFVFAISLLQIIVLELGKIVVASCKELVEFGLGEGFGLELGVVREGGVLAKHVV